MFQTLFVNPTVNLVIAFYNLFLQLHIPGAFGFAIISLTVFVRLLLHPFFKQQMHTTKKMQQLKPHLDQLSKKHKDDAKKLQEAQMKLYQDHGVNPLAGCLFALIQIPIFLGLYNTLSMMLVKGTGPEVIKHINSVLYFSFLKIQSIDAHFFIFNLALTPSKAHIWYYYLIPVVTVGLQYAQTQLSMASMTPTAPPEEKKDEKKKESMEEEFQSSMNMAMKYFFPLMIGTASYNFPVGLSLYWNIFSLFSIMQQLHINRDPKSNAIILTTTDQKPKTSDTKS